MPVTIESLPIFVRAGAIVFRQPVVQHTGEMSGQPLLVSAYPAARSERSLYEDDGESTAYARGELSRRRFAQQRDAKAATLEIGAMEGRYRPAGRDLLLTFVGEAQTTRVLLDGRPLPRAEAFALARGGSGWAVSDAGTVVRTKDRPEALRVTVER